MKTVLKLLIVVLLIYPICVFSQTWHKINGTSNYVNHIFLPGSHPGWVVVASDSIPTDFQEDIVQFPPYNGLLQDGFRISNDNGNTFGDLKLDSFSVYSIIEDPANPNTWLAAVHQSNSGGILTSTNNGSTWSIIDSERCSESSQIVSMAAKNSNPPFYYAAELSTTIGFRYSNDGFINCKTNPNFDIRPRNIKISPIDSNLIFIAGDQSSQHVFRSYNNGKTWLSDSFGLKGYRILSLLPSMINKSIVICSADSVDPLLNSFGKGIFVSNDTGKTWNYAGAKGLRVFSLAQNPSNPKLIAAACDFAGVYLSSSGGFGWEKHNDGIPDTVSVRVVEILPGNPDGCIILAGTFGDGLYKSSKIITSIDQNSFFESTKLRIISVAPQPFSNQTTIRWQNSTNNEVSLIISDCFGREVFSNKYQSFENSITWKPDNLSNGIYYIILSNNDEKVVEKIVLIK